MPHEMKTSAQRIRLAPSLRTRVGAALLAPTALVACAYDFDGFMPSSSDAAVVADAGAITTDRPETATNAVDGAQEVATPCTEAMARAFEGHCYFPLATSSDWTGAQSACAAAGAHLVTITSAAEEAFVETMTSGRERWIGLHRPFSAPSTPSAFTWVTGESASYAKWAYGEPNGSGPCARLRTSNDWGDLACNTGLGAICERD